MNSEERLAGIYDAMVRAGIRALVLGGHAVRFYGIGRFTLDYDLGADAPKFIFFMPLDQASAAAQVSA